MSQVRLCPRLSFGAESMKQKNCAWGLHRHPSILERLWSCALGVYCGTASGVAGQSDAGMTVPVAEGTDEV